MLMKIKFCYFFKLCMYFVSKFGINFATFTLRNQLGLFQADFISLGAWGILKLFLDGSSNTVQMTVNPYEGDVER